MRTNRHQHSGNRNRRTIGNGGRCIFLIYATRRNQQHIVGRSVVLVDREKGHGDVSLFETVVQPAIDDS